MVVVGKGTTIFGVQTPNDSDHSWVLQVTTIPLPTSHLGDFGTRMLGQSEETQEETLLPSGGSYTVDSSEIPKNHRLDAFETPTVNIWHMG